MNGIFIIIIICFLPNGNTPVILRGDLNKPISEHEDENGTDTVCVYGVNSFPSAFLYSIETQVSKIVCM